MGNGRNLEINGVGKVVAGEYDQVSINGVGKIQGDFKCESLEISGVGKLDNSIQVGTLEVNGKAKVKGDCTGEKLDVAGFATINGDVKCNEMKISGLVTCRSVESDILICDGIIKAENTINSGEIIIDYSGKCSAKEIYGEKIKIRMSPNRRQTSIVDKILIPKYGFQLELIEGDHIEIENVKAKVVRGKNIIIGKGCNIDRVEYHQDIQIHKESMVKENQRC